MIVIHRLERSLVWDRDGDAPVSVTSPHVPNEGKFPNKIESGEVADQGWTEPKKRGDGHLTRKKHKQQQ